MTRYSRGVLDILDGYSQDLLVIAKVQISLCFVLRRSKDLHRCRLARGSRLRVDGRRGSRERLLPFLAKLW